VPKGKGGVKVYYPEELIQEIRERNDIVGVISEYVTLTRKGHNYFGVCPFHNEKTPSFSVNAQEQYYHCFGCGAGGNVYTFLMQIDNMNFVEAVKALADRAHMDLPEAELSPQEKKRLMRRNRLLEITTEAARYFYYQLTRTEQGKHALGYLDSRKVTEEFRRRFGLGYAPISRDGLYRFLQSKGYGDDEIRGAGLSNGGGEKVYDRFFNRLMFPIFDAQGRAIAFGGRVMGSGEPKYLNSPETEIFNKRKNLYGMQIAKKSRRGKILVVEGYMDVLSLHQAGFDNAVASLGTALTKEQALLMKKYVSDVVLIYDSDQAGTKAAQRAIPILEDTGLYVKVLRIPGYKDPDEFIKNKSREEFEALIQEALDPIDFEMVVLNSQTGADTVEGKVKTLKALAQRLSEISNPLERELHIRDVAQKMQVDEQSLKREVDEIQRMSGLLERRAPVNADRRQEREDGLVKAQKLVLAVLLHRPALYSTLKEYISPTDFPLREPPTKDFPDGKDNIYRIVADYIFAKAMQGETPRLADVISQVEEAADQEKITALSEYEIPSDTADLEKLMTETIRTIRLNSLEDEVRSNDDLQKLQEIINQKRALQALRIEILP
jgi:DNA primase